jgi:hypothetical protein
MFLTVKAYGLKKKKTVNKKGKIMFSFVYYFIKEVFVIKKNFFKMYNNKYRGAENKFFKDYTALIC